MKVKPIELPRKCRRRAVTKSFEGCAACKARKLKCDESRPGCLRCQKSGRRCPGYWARSDLRWSEKHEVFRKPLKGPRHRSVKGSEAICMPSSSKGRTTCAALLQSSNTAGISICRDECQGQHLPSRCSRRQSKDHVLDQLCLRLTDSESTLVPFYFKVVCPIFSTFDSPQNLFRSFVEERWQSSQTIFYAVLSMAAAKMSWKEPRYRARALAYQSHALNYLRADISRAKSWSSDLIFVILMLGLSTAWHDVTDLGIPHLEAMRQAVRYLNRGTYDSDERMLEFFRNALIYWEMVTVFVDRDGAFHRHLEQKATSSTLMAFCERSGGSTRPSCDPHPWSSIASGPQEMFTRIVRLIMKARGLSRNGSIHEHIALEQSDILQSAQHLDCELWSFHLPKPCEISDTGDKKTPAIHHLLLAEAYMFANFFQLYQYFPQVFRKRRVSAGDVALANSPYPAFVTRSSTFSWSNLWPSSQNMDEQLALLGISLIQRLQQIPSDSGTLCVQPLLLLIASTSLSPAAAIVQDVPHLRRFVLDRLAHCSNAYLSEPMHRVLLTVIDIFKMLDQGRKVFWLDVIETMGLVTIIG